MNFKLFQVFSFWRSISCISSSVVLVTRLDTRCILYTRKNPWGVWISAHIVLGLSSAPSICPFLTMGYLDNNQREDFGACILYPSLNRSAIRSPLMASCKLIIYGYSFRAVSAL